MTIHETIKGQIKDALRAKDTIRLDTLRGLNALFQNELIMSKEPINSNGQFLADDKVLMLIKRSTKQRKDSIDQFSKGGRMDLADKESQELAILESFMPSMMTKEQVRIIVKQRVESMKDSGMTIDQKSTGKITGMIMKELSGKADGNDVKSIVEEILVIKKN